VHITIDPAVADDIDALVKLLALLFSIEQDFTPDDAAQRYGLELLLGDSPRAQVFVARTADRQVVGMVSAQLVISTAVGGASAWIEDLVVSEAFRGRGVGQALLGNAREWAAANGARRIQLLADAGNIPALRFYQHLDWQATQLFAWKQGFLILSPASAGAGEDAPD